MDKTKLNEHDPQHRLLMGILTTFVERFGYSSRELFQLLEDAKNELYFPLKEIHSEKEKNKKKTGN